MFIAFEWANRQEKAEEGMAGPPWGCARVVGYTLVLSGVGGRAP